MENLQILRASNNRAFVIVNNSTSRWWNVMPLLKYHVKNILFTLGEESIMTLFWEGNIHSHRKHTKRIYTNIWLPMNNAIVWFLFLCVF